MAGTAQLLRSSAKPRLRGRRPAMTLAAAVVLVLASAMLAGAQSYQVLYSFAVGTDGANPSSGLVQDAEGNLCGTTSGGGAYGNGASFKLAGTIETIPFSFTGTADGGVPGGGLVVDPQNHLYGTTRLGGGTGCGGPGCGTVFKTKAEIDNQQKVLYSFVGGRDGAFPTAGLAEDSTGDVYGTTSGGGTSGNGTVFELGNTIGHIVLYSFSGGSDGGVPVGVLTRDTSSNLYGATAAGGAQSDGVVYKLDVTGKESVLHNFAGGTDGSQPMAGVIRDSSGNLYGTTKLGGNSGGPCSAGCGVVYKLDSTGNETILYRFTGGTDGSQPLAPLVFDSAGNLYGTTAFGGNNALCGGSGCGVVFKLDTSNNFSVLHTFGGGTDGTNPSAGLFETGGLLYGTTPTGGSSGLGTVFQVQP